MDLLYELEFPVYPHEALEELGIHKTGDFTIQVKVRPCLPGVIHLMWQLGACLMFITPLRMQSSVRATSVQRHQMLLRPVVKMHQPILAK